MSKIQITYQKLQSDVNRLAQQIIDSNVVYANIYGVPRGGVPIAIMLAGELNLPLVNTIDEISDLTLVVDDLVDSGKTRKKFTNDFAALYNKPHSPASNYYSVEKLDGWIEFPYEETDSDEQSIVTRLLEVLGEDPTREGLRETPKRVIKFYKEFLKTPEFNFTAFDSEEYDEMIVQKDIPFFSLCEHHMAPFFGQATVAYIPNGKIIGLSKLARTVEMYSRRLQNQERITTQVAERLQKELDPLGVAVSLTARHFCMEMRGVKTHDVHTTTTKLIGAFRDAPEPHHEFMAILKG